MAVSADPTEDRWCDAKVVYDGQSLSYWVDFALYDNGQLRAAAWLRMPTGQSPWEAFEVVAKICLFAEMHRPLPGEDDELLWDFLSKYLKYDRSPF